MKAKVIRVNFEERPKGLVLAKSADLASLCVIGQSRAAAEREVPLVLAAILEADGVDAQVVEAEPLDGNPVYIIVPRNAA